jgi:hypothetical protein
MRSHELTLTRQLAGRVVLVCLICLGCFLAGGGIKVRSLRADQTTRCTSNGPNQTVCRIDEPIVTKQLQDYPQVTFQVGDSVTVEAGGCVQTGGTGATWKRYVNPSGPNSNRLYWGTISIPGATEGVVRISDVIGKTLTVSAGLAPPLFLRLGYVDDDYGDNGYSSHDDGTENQCKNQPNAFVVLTIDHPAGTTASCAGNSGSSPLDVAWTDCDLNGFPMNPRFQYQISTGKVPPLPLTLCPSAQQIIYVNGSSGGVPVINFPQSCISWPVSYDSGALCGPHVNYFAVTYQGPVNWWLKSTVGTDDDYNYRMYPSNNAGLVGSNPSVDGMEIEFDSDETIDHFSSPLWTHFHDMVHNNNSAAQKYILGKTAVVTSLLGLDCGHPSCSSEEHPAYTMAVDMDDSNLDDDQWGVFARNWGDEGYCSDDEHNLPGSDLKVLIPWLPGATTVAVLPDTQFYPFSNSDSNASVSSPQITIATGQGILVEFTLPDSGTQMGVDGEVHLQWTMSAAARTALLNRSRLRPAFLLPTADEEESEKPENRVAALISSLDAPKLQVLRSRLASTVATPPAVLRAKLPMLPVATVAKLPPAPHLARPVVPQSVRNARMVQKNEASRLALCEAYNNNVPGFPAACQQRPPGR